MSLAPERLPVRLALEVDAGGSDLVCVRVDGLAGDDDTLAWPPPVTGAAADLRQTGMSVAPLLRRAIEHRADRTRQECIRISVEAPPDRWSIGLEAAFVRDAPALLGVDSDTSLAWAASCPNPRHAHLGEDGKLRIVAALAANGLGEEKLAITYDRQGLLGAGRAPRSRIDPTNITMDESALLSKLRQHLARPAGRRRAEVVWISAHGVPGGIYLDDEFVSSTALARLIGDQADLVVVTACSSANAGSEHPSVIEAIARQGTPVTVGINGSIEDRALRGFASTVLGVILAGGTIDLALLRGRQAIAHTSAPDWWRPVLVVQRGDEQEPLIGEQVRPPRVVRPRASSEPFHRGVRLVGRDREVTAARALLQAGPAFLTIAGPPGSGKSELARSVARDLAQGRGDDWIDCWINGESASSVEDGLITLGIDLGIVRVPDRDQPGSKRGPGGERIESDDERDATRTETAQQVIDALNDPMIPGYVIVVDNLVDPADLGVILGLDGTGLVMVTTRSPEPIGRSTERIELGALTEEDAATLLVALTGYEDPEDRPYAEALVRAVDRVPLGVVQAAAQVRRLGLTFAESLERFERARAEADADPLPSLVAQVIADLDPSAQLLVRILAELNPDGVPATVVTSAAAASLLGLTPGEASAGLYQLQAAQLVHQGEEGAPLRFHRLTAQVVSDAGDLDDTAGRGRFESAADAAAKLLVAAWPASEDLPGLTLAFDLAPNAERLLDRWGDRLAPMTSGHLQLLLGRTLARYGDIARGSELLRRASALLQPGDDADDRQLTLWADAAGEHALAVLADRTDRSKRLRRREKDARAVLLPVLERLPDDHPARARALSRRSELGYTAADRSVTGASEEDLALDDLTTALTLCDLPGATTLDRCTTLGRLATVHYGLGQFNDALQHAEERLDLAERAMPNSRQHVLALRRYGLIQRRRGRLALARLMMERSISIEQDLQEEAERRYPSMAAQRALSTGSILNNLALTLLNIGDVTEALDAATAAVDQSTALEHPSPWRLGVRTATRGSVLLAAGRFDEACAALEGAARIAEDHGFRRAPFRRAEAAYAAWLDGRDIEQVAEIERRPGEPDRLTSAADEEYAGVMCNVVRALIMVERMPERAGEARTLAAHRTKNDRPAHHPEKLRIDLVLAAIEGTAGNVTGMQDQLERVRRIVIQELRPDHWLLTHADLITAQVERRQERRATAT